MSPVHRIVKTFTAAEKAAWEAAVAEAESEVPETLEYFRKATAAAAEETFSGELRRAIHHVHDRQMTLDALLAAAGIPWDALEPFMVGEASLPSDVIDRLAGALGLHLQPANLAGGEDEECP
jgi:hypothetical protein